MKPATKDAYQLLHDGTLALAKVEAAGIRIDERYLKATTERVGRRIDKLRARLKDDKEVYGAWRKRFGTKANLASRPQLAEVLFGCLKVPYPWDGAEAGGKTATGRHRTDDETLTASGHPFYRRYLKLMKLEKLHGTYLKGIAREVCQGYLHPSFNLNTVTTYRSSSSNPNFQNVPIRDPEIGALIRKAFIPRKGRVLVENDFGGVEVRIAACYHQDPRMLEYLNDPAKDMHRDMAAQLYKLEPGQVSKMARYCAKNMFVFPAFYGSYFVQCAPNLWNAIAKHKLEVGGVPLGEHLAAQGIRSLGACRPKEEPRPGTFEQHVRRVEEDFWGRRFAAYAAWKKRWHEEYLRRGWFRLKTGFVCQGVYARNDVLNYPVQGAAFHCLLKSLIEVLRRVEKRCWRVLAVGQIHDSILADVPEAELQDYLALVHGVITRWLPRQWPWIVVPLEVEAEVAADNWFGKKQWG